ncbi:outer membrane beta-barrel protein [Flavobacterium sp. KJJ]|uniref:outer membrane beta-barrel protein n=1 Tax=Flavobacterium sp. KJJ TaxID=1270193 RepID=UPI000492ED70|nr:outer membrane beta-barrel protein [Flavobacterium sp. KJJ]
MKKLLLGVALFVATISHAQKNSLLVGGNIGFSSEKIDDSKTTNFEFSPKVGYQFAERWTIGAEASIISSDYDMIQKDIKISGNSQKYKIGGFMRYTAPLSDLFSFYTDLGAGSQSASSNNINGIYANLTPALFINMKRGFGLNFSIGGINYDNLEGTDYPKQERFGFDFGKTVKIGISKNFQL